MFPEKLRGARRRPPAEEGQPLQKELEGNRFVLCYSQTHTSQSRPDRPCPWRREAPKGKSRHVNPRRCLPAACRIKPRLAGRWPRPGAAPCLPHPCPLFTPPRHTGGSRRPQAERSLSCLGGPCAPSGTRPGHARLPPRARPPRPGAGLLGVPCAAGLWAAGAPARSLGRWEPRGLHSVSQLTAQVAGTAVSPHLLSSLTGAVRVQGASVPGRRLPWHRGQGPRSWSAKLRQPGLPGAMAGGRSQDPLSHSPSAPSGSSGTQAAPPLTSGTPAGPLRPPPTGYQLCQAGSLASSTPYWLPAPCGL